MMDQKRRSPAQDRASKSMLGRQDENKNSNLLPFRQASILWQAHKECVQRAQSDPLPVYNMIAQIIACECKTAHLSEHQ